MKPLLSELLEVERLSFAGPLGSQVLLCGSGVATNHVVSRFAFEET